MPTPAQPTFPRNRGSYDQPVHPLKPKAKVYVMLVGINDYPRPNALYGCLKDIELIEQFLLDHFKIEQDIPKVEEDKDPFEQGQSYFLDHLDHFHSLHINRLLNQQATYSNIIKGFRSFLRLAGPQDIVWFHFSGHGSEELTAPELLDLEPSGKDQTLVCYPDQGEDKPEHLADKEIALLLHEVANQKRDGQPKAGTPHIIVSLDCCHSGSGTREEVDIKARNFKKPLQEDISPKDQRRSLDAYLDAYFKTTIQSGESIEIATAPHILLSACEHMQKAGDTYNGGIFTSSLIETLRLTNGHVNYAELFSRTRYQVDKIASKKNHEQTPQFETIALFDPYSQFLDGSKLGTPMTYQIYPHKGVWLIKCGAIHGLSIKEGENPVFEIHTGAPEHKLLGTIEVKAVGAQVSILEENPNLKSWHQAYKALYGVVRKLLAPTVYVELEGKEEILNTLKEKWDNSINLEWKTSESIDHSASLRVNANEKQFTIWDNIRSKPIKQLPIQPESTQIIMSNLNSIVRWKRTLHIHNPKSAIQELVNLELEVIFPDKSETFHETPTVIDGGDENFFKVKNTQNIYLKFNPKIKITNCKQKLYCYLLHFRSNFSISSYEDQITYDPKSFQYKDATIPMWKKPWIWGLSEEDEQSKSYFKLLVTTEELDHHQLLQAGLEDHRAKVKRIKPLSIENDWCSITMEVTLNR